MNLRHICIHAALAALLVCTGLPAHAIGNTPSARSKRLAERFHSLCMQSVPDFQKLGQQANALHLQLFEERQLPTTDGSDVKQRNWLVPDASGEFVLTSQEARKPRRVIGCGIAATDAGGEDLMLALSRDTKLGMPIRQKLQDPVAGKAIWWNAHVGGKAVQILLAYDIPERPGVLVNLIYTPHR